MQTNKMWIGGKWVEAESGKTYAVVNPATEQEIASVPLGGKEDVEKAVRAARQAFPIWSNKPLAERSEILKKIAASMRKRAQELVGIHVLNHGSPVWVANLFALSPPLHFEYAAEVSKTVMGIEGLRPAPSSGFPFVRREPYGVCAGIIPWNIPLMISSKVASALATGNTCIIKPPSAVPLVALKFAEILEEHDLPPGTVNILTGPGSTVGETLASHPGVDMVAFTGGFETGKAIMAAASKTIKPVFLELGGKNPFIVLEDADLNEAVDKAASSCFFNSGMVCGSPGRYYIHHSLYEKFIEKFVTAAKKVKVGDPNDKNTQMGPVISSEHRDKVENYIKIGREEGARLVWGGQKYNGKGYFVMPTVFADVDQNMRIGREEIFGPVACIMKPFSSDEEVIRLANDTIFGLSAFVFTKSVAKGIKFANEIQAGTVWINKNTPNFGSDLPWGGFKGSGFGKEGSVYGLMEYTHLKLVNFDTTI